MSLLRANRKAFTLVELLIAAAALGMVGSVFYVGLRNMAYLSARNAATNLTHIEARTAIHRAVSEIRDSVSIPQLVDASRNSLGTSAGPAAGVSYQQLVAGPYVVWSTASAGQNQVVLSSRAGDPAVTPGMRLIVPAFYLEDDITAVSAASGSPLVRTVTLAHPINTTMTCTAGSPNFVAYYTQRSALVVNGTELRYFQNVAASTYSVVSRNFQTPQPFSIPGGDNRFVQANFITRDPRILNRNFKSTDLQMTITIPYRFRLTIYQ